MEHTPIYLAGQTAKMLGLPCDIIKGRDPKHQAAWLNGYASAVPLRPQKNQHRGRVLPVIRRT